jgi:hypothetical protein
MASRQTAASKRGIFATRGRKIAAAIGAAFLASLGAGIGARALNSAENASKRVLAGSNAPIQVRVMPPGSFFAGHPFAPYYVVPKSEVSSPEKLDPTELTGDEPFDFSFAQRHGAIPGSPEIVRFQIRGRSDEPVTIDDIKIHAVRRTAPLQGWYVASPGCGGLAIRTAEIDLDAPTPRVSFVDQSGSEKRITLFVTRTDIEVIELQASTEQSMVDWTAEVFYSGPDGDGSVTVDDGGRPFRVTTESASDGYRLQFFPKKAVTREPSWDENGIAAC